MQCTGIISGNIIWHC